MIWNLELRGNHQGRGGGRCPTGLRATCRVGGHVRRDFWATTHSEQLQQPLCCAILSLKASAVPWGCVPSCSDLDAVPDTSAWRVRNHPPRVRNLTASHDFLRPARLPCFVQAQERDNEKKKERISHPWLWHCRSPCNKTSWHHAEVEGRLPWLRHARQCRGSWRSHSSSGTTSFPSQPSISCTPRSSGTLSVFCRAASVI